LVIEIVSVDVLISIEHFVFLGILIYLEVLEPVIARVMLVMELTSPLLESRVPFDMIGALMVVIMSLGPDTTMSTGFETHPDNLTATPDGFMTLANPCATTWSTD